MLNVSDGATACEGTVESVSAGTGLTEEFSDPGPTTTVTFTAS